MGASKLDIYSKQVNEIAAIAKVFAHPARVATSNKRLFPICE